MKSNHAKVANKILGKPMIEWVADAAIAAGCLTIIVVVGSHAQEVRHHRRLLCERRGVHRMRGTGRTAGGTGHAVKVALACGIRKGAVVLNRRPAAHPDRNHPAIRRDRRPPEQPAGAALSCCRQSLRLRPHRRSMMRAPSSRSSNRRSARPPRPPSRNATPGRDAFDDALLAAHIDEIEQRQRPGRIPSARHAQPSCQRPGSA